MQKPVSRRDVLQGSAALAVGTVFASPARAAAPEPVAITPDLVAAATKEGKLVFYSSMDLPVGERLGKAFEAAYPGITVQIERSGSERLFQRVAQEFDSNIHAADVVNSADASHFIPWKKSGWLMPFVPEDVAKHFPDNYRDPDGMASTTWTVCADEPALILATRSGMPDRPLLRASGSRRLSIRYCLSADRSRPDWSFRSLRRYS